MNSKFIICDLDGTLFDISHRLHFIDGKVKDWDGFSKAIVNDTPIQPILNLIKLYHRQGYDIVFITGRMLNPETYKNTMIQLDSAFCRDYALYGRAVADFRPDHEIKLEIARDKNLTPDNVEFVLEDRNSVVNMWRDNGYTCLQVADGDF